LSRNKAIIEVHLLGFRSNMYKKEIEIFFVKKLREELRFSSLEKLRKQIERDVKNARKIL
jgi:riboflavin kinase/FMN adenylyltransferase